MAIFGMVLALIAMLAGGAFWLDDNAYDRGYAENKSEVLEVKNTELAQLNQDNIILQNRIDKINRQKVADNEKTNRETNIQLSEIKASRAAAINDLTTALQLQLSNAENARKDKADSKRAIITAFINGREGTEGSKLAPKTRFDLEQVSFDGNEAIILLRSCVKKYEKARAICGIDITL